MYILSNSQNSELGLQRKRSSNVSSLVRNQPALSDSVLNHENKGQNDQG